MTLQAEQALADSVQEAHSHAPTEGDKVVCVSELASFTQMESRDVRTQQFSHKLQVRANPLQDARVSAALCDSSPAVDLAAIIRKLKNHFDHYFYELEPKVVKKFTQRAQKSATVSLKQFSPKIKIVREGKCAGGTQPRSANAVKTTLFTSESECQAGCMTERSSKMSEGFSINFRLTRQMNDILQATIAENVGLIKSIHTAYFNQVQEIVMQGVKNGRDMDYIRKELVDRFRISERKAKLIARDQTNKAMQAISRARSLEAGIQEATWVHIPGAKMSRETHKNFDGKKFDLNKGMYDKDVGKFIMPGELINCNCRFKLILPDVQKD